MKLAPEWAGQTSRDQRATVLLRQEHEILLALFRRQRDTGAAGEERAALQEEIAAVIELIDRVEREVFFPALPAKYAPLLRAFLADHEVLAGCLARLRTTALMPTCATTPASSMRVEQLAREHLVQEESLLYSMVEREHPELNRQLYRALVDARARIASRGVPREAGTPH